MTADEALEVAATHQLHCGHSRDRCIETLADEVKRLTQALHEARERFEVIEDRSCWNSRESAKYGMQAIDAVLKGGDK
jgi:hypothetical protein